MSKSRKTLVPFRRIASRGFTIIELLVATMVFSVVLLVVTSGILQVARVYYKGVTESNTQSTARSIIDTITQAIQFSGGDITETLAPEADTDQVFCVGNQQYSYRLGWQVEDKHDIDAKQTWHGLVQYDTTSCSSASTPQDLTLQTVPGRDLIGPHMRLANLVVDDLGSGQYKVQVRIVYGDSDLLDDPYTAAAKCKAVRAGTQFCAVSDLSTIVVKRVE